jgi:SAM-dependent methyltransferase
VNETWITHRERYDRMLAPFGDALLDAAALTAGDTVLDVGCGAGTTTIEAAEAVRPDGSVVGIDIDERLATEARRRLDGIANAMVVTADVATYRLDIPADVAISRFGTMQFADQIATHRNIAHNLGGRGRLAVVVWQTAAQNLWQSLPFQAVQAHLSLGPPEPPGNRGPFALADPSRLCSILDASGFEHPDLKPIELAVWVARDIDDAVDFFEDDAGDALRAITTSEVFDSITSTLRELLTPYVTREGVLLPAAAWVVTTDVTRTPLS